MLQSIDILQDIKANQVNNNGIDIISYLSPKKKSKKLKKVDNYWIERYELPCPYLEHKLMNPSKKVHKRVISPREKKTKKPLPLYLPYNTRRIDSEHFGRLSIKSNNDVARFKTKQVTENTPGIQRWPEIKQKSDDLDLVGKRPLSAARPLSPVRPQSSRPNSGIGGISSRLNRDIRKSYDYLNDTYQAILSYDQSIQEEENAVTELRAALLSILNGVSNTNNDDSNNYNESEYSTDQVSPVLFESINHIIALKNFDPNNINNNIINSDDNSNDNSYDNYENKYQDQNHHHNQNHNTMNCNGYVKNAYIGNNSMYSVDAPIDIKDIINSEGPSLIEFSLTQDSIHNEPTIKPSKYTNKLRSIISDTKIDDNNANDNNNNYNTSNDNINFTDSMGVGTFNTRNSFDYLYNGNYNLDNIDDNMNADYGDNGQPISPELKNLLDLDQSSMVSVFILLFLFYYHHHHYD